MKPTDEEAAARRVLARKLSIDMRERIAFLEDEAKRKRPNLEAIRHECQTIRESIDMLLGKYDAKHGTETEWVATESRLRGFIAKQSTHIDNLTTAIEWQQRHLQKRDALLRQSVDLVESLVKLCQRNGVDIPPALMGEPL